MLNFSINKTMIFKRMFSFDFAAIQLQVYETNSPYNDGRYKNNKDVDCVFSLL